jgi:hypothetical protein
MRKINEAEFYITEGESSTSRFTMNGEMQASRVSPVILRHGPRAGARDRLQPGGELRE